MAEPIATFGLGAIAAYLGKDGIQKLLGPTADYLGEGLKDFTKKRVEAIGHIFKKAEQILGQEIESPGEVPPKVLKAILDEGSYCNSRLAIEYFGGILASSRSEDGRDDRGARIAKMVDLLSTYQLRSHYLIYSTISNLSSFKGFSFREEDRDKMATFIPMTSFYDAMQFSDSERCQLESLLNHIFTGLRAEELICDRLKYGSREAVNSFIFEDFFSQEDAIFTGVTESGIVCQPSELGAEVFLWAFGHANKPLDFIFDNEFSSEVKGVPTTLRGARLLTE
jgi:hypothetical protein